MGSFTNKHLEQLLEEFQILYSGTLTQTQDIPIGNVMVLSAPPSIVGVEWIEDNEENRGRIHRAMSICDDIVQRHIVPTLYLNAKSQQLYSLMAFVEELYNDENFPCHVVPLKVINCGNLGVANTRTQMEAIVQNPRLCRELAEFGTTIFVTTRYHVPRTRRTARMVIADRFPYTVIGARSISEEADMKLVGSEISKIIEYVEKGDISPEP